MMRALWSILTALICVTVPSTVARPQITVSPMDLLGFDALGRHDDVQRALEEASHGDLGVVLDGLRGSADKWIQADGPAFADRRRAAVATFALEVARVALDEQWARSKQILEWTWTLLRAVPQPPAWERTWHLAAFALMEGARDHDAITAHLQHAVSRFPDEPRFALVRAFLAESAFWDDEVQTNGHGHPPVSAYEPLLDQPDLRNEAALRLGYFAWRLDRPAEALELLARIEHADDPGQASLKALFAGWSYDRLGRRDEALQAFRSAVDAAPGTQTATMFLALRLNAAGRRDEAGDLVDRAVSLNPPPFDPWRNFGYGDLRRFPIWLAQLRTAAK